ncbi:hypothetical protein LC612_36605 [Nostoc sp. CHAB 5834]|nr:hypothetical protein [Nostoc sp. CHAB 5834]
MKRLKFLTLALLPLALMACGESPTSTPNTSEAAQLSAIPDKLPISLESVTAHASGFSVGSKTSTTKAYVFFDPQCAHCAALWHASLPLLDQAEFIWIPVAMLNKSSGPQGAVLLSAADPFKSMAEHEKSITQRGGGISAPSSIPADVVLKLKKNGKLFSSFDLGSVPFVIAKNQATGTVVTQKGALPTPALATLLGLQGHTSPQLFSPVASPAN